MTTELDTIIKHIAKGVAHDILCAGSSTNGKATRIALKVGNGSVDFDVRLEKDNGGLCESALIGVIVDSLRARLGA